MFLSAGSNGGTSSVPVATSGFSAAGKSSSRSNGSASPAAKNWPPMMQFSRNTTSAAGFLVFSMGGKGFAAKLARRRHLLKRNDLRGIHGLPLAARFVAFAAFAFARFRRTATSFFSVLTAPPLRENSRCDKLSAPFIRFRIQNPLAVWQAPV
ncbi:MAG: hypothetical protein WBW78_06855 [Terrimicrobiaceae bacterium]